jgi:hypothetical protein
LSQVANDKEVLKTRRPDRLEGAAAPLRDQIPGKLLAALKKDQIGNKIDKIMAAGDADRGLWLERQRTYLADYDEFLESSAEGPFEGSSNLHLPMPLIVARALHARFLQALLGVEPYFTLRARTEGQGDRAMVVSDVMSYALKTWGNYNQGTEAVLDTWLWNWVTTGTGLLKLRWDCRYESFIDVVEEEVEAPPKYNPDNTLSPQKTKQETEKRVTKKWFEGPVLDVVDAEDLLIIGGGGDVQLADSVHHTQYLTADELWTLADREVFDQGAVETVINAGPDVKIGRAGTTVKEDRAANAGQAQVDTEVDLDRYEIVESYMNYDVDGSGLTSKIVVWTHRKTRTELRATYLRRINKSGEIPIFKIDFHRRPGQTYGVGIIEMMHPISKELDAIHNIRIDSGMITNVPMFFYRPTSSMNPETIQFEPGAGIPLDDPQRDINIPTWGNKTGWGFQEEQSLQTLIERLTGTNDLTFGAMSGGQGATRTASGVRALMGESNANLDVFLRRLNFGWGRALRCMLHFLQQRIPAGLSFRVTGESGNDYWRHIRSQDDIAGDFDIEVCPNSANSNKQIQIEQASQVLQLVSNPLYIQTGTIGSPQIYEAIKNYLKVYGVKDYGRYVQAPQGYQYVPTPAEEIQRLLRGIDTPVLPNADHQGFLAAFQEIHDSDDLLGQLTTEQTIALARHAQAHEQMAAALAAQAAQTANIQQQAVNSQAAAGAANPAANPMGAAPAQQGLAPGEAPPAA